LTIFPVGVAQGRRGVPVKGRRATVAPAVQGSLESREGRVCQASCSAGRYKVITCAAKSTEGKKGNLQTAFLVWRTTGPVLQMARAKKKCNTPDTVLQKIRHVRKEKATESAPIRKRGDSGTQGPLGAQTGKGIKVSTWKKIVEES